MKYSEIRRIFEEAKKKVQVNCDEYHMHNANCLSGSEDSINICKLVEEIERLRHLIIDSALQVDKE